MIKYQKKRDNDISTIFWKSHDNDKTIYRQTISWGLLRKLSLQELVESRITFVDSSRKVGWLSLKALRKQDGFCWKLYESRRAFVESSTKEGLLSLKALWKKDSFRWKLYESRMAFVESSTKEGLLLLKALRKQALWEQDGFSWKPCESLSKSA